jgi:hypothetical protein
MTDAESVIAGILSLNWNATNAAKPTIIYDDSVTQRSIACPHSIKVYQVDGTSTPKGLGYPAEEVNVRITVDLQGTNRALILNQVAEAQRALLASRKNPGSTLTPANTTFDLLTVTNEVKQSGYAGYYHFTIDCFLRQTYKSI